MQFLKNFATKKVLSKEMSVFKIPCEKLMFLRDFWDFLLHFYFSAKMAKSPKNIFLKILFFYKFLEKITITNKLSYF